MMRVTMIIMIDVLMMTMMMMITMVMLLIAAVTMLGIITTKFQFRVNKRFVQNRSHRSLFQENLLAHIILQLLR